MNNQLTQVRLKELLLYDQETGYFTWIKRTSNRVKAGSRAGNRTGRYWQINVDGRSYLAHRLAWLYMHGVMPSTGIDHRYGVEAGDGMWNLRLATQAENMQNERKPRRNNKSGYLGVAPTGDGKKWFARVNLRGKAIHLGRFLTPEEAFAAYVAGKAKHHPFSLLPD